MLSWRKHAVLGGDLVAAGVAMAIAFLTVLPGTDLSLLVGLVIIGLSWPVLIAARGLYRERAYAHQPDYRRVLGTAAVLVAVLALSAPLAPERLSYSHLVAFAVALPAVSLLARWAVDARLRRLRRRGVALRRVLAVGTGPEISTLIDRLAATTDQAYVVVGACVEGSGQLVEDVSKVGRLPLLRHNVDPVNDSESIDVVLDCVQQVEVDTVCLTPGSLFTAERFRKLSWALAERGVGLMTMPGQVEVAPHRMLVEQAGEATLLHTFPPASSTRPVAKAALDRIAAAVGLVIISPLLLGLAAVVRSTSAGPALYRQTRVGKDGRRFTMYKFRSMYVDADARRAELVQAVDADGPMFKMYDDPRITRIGRYLRKYSLDELPQLINVLRGEMSLVGPRPPLPEEVATYGDVEGRRLRVTPGMTGLWQVSGRSNLTWDETTRLDLRYVDNHRLVDDLRIIGRTAGAVVRGTGAY